MNKIPPRNLSNRLNINSEDGESPVQMLTLLVLVALLAAGIYFQIQWSQQSAAEQRCLQNIAARLSTLETLVPTKTDHHWYYHFDKKVKDYDPTAPDGKHFPLDDLMSKIINEEREVISVQRVGMTDSFDILSRSDLRKKGGR